MKLMNDELPKKSEIWKDNTTNTKVRIIAVGTTDTINSSNDVQVFYVDAYPKKKSHINNANYRWWEDENKLPEIHILEVHKFMGNMTQVIPSIDRSENIWGY